MKRPAGRKCEKRTSAVLRIVQRYRATAFKLLHVLCVNKRLKTPKCAFVILNTVISTYCCARDTVYRNTVLANTVLANTVPRNTLLGNTVLKYTGLRNTLLRNIALRSTVLRSIVLRIIVFKSIELVLF